MKHENKTMNRTFAVLTGVGGHFLNGRRAKGYAYFLALVIWPFLAFIVQIAVSIAVADRPSHPVIGVLIFALGFVAIWTVSVIQAIKDHSKAPAREKPISMLEPVLASFVLYGVTLYSLLALVIVPMLEPGQRIPLFEISSNVRTVPRSGAKLLPAERGSLVLAGTVLEKDRPLGNARLVLLFHDGFRTPPLETNAAGEFEYQLPPGQWRFVGPLVSGLESRSVYVVFTPGIATPTPTFKVEPSAPTVRVEMKVVAE